MNHKKVQKGETIDSWLSRAPQRLQPIVHKIRQKILAEECGFVENVKWAHPYYTLQGFEAFSIMWHSKHVGFELWNGADLPNPFGTIEGTGKKARHIKIRSLDGVEWKAVDQAITDTILYLNQNKP